MRETLHCHCNICRTCFNNWIKSKIKQEDIIPHIRCPGEDCDHSMPYSNFTQNYNLKTVDFYQWTMVYCEKMLAR